MKFTTVKILMFVAALFVSTAAEAGTKIQTLVWDAADGDRINGFLYQQEKLPKDAPVALLLHGLTGSSLHWLASGFPSYGGQLSDMLVEKGYRVVAIDARAHGTRRAGLSPYERVMKARKGDSADYQAMIKNTIADYDIVLSKVQKAFPEAKRLIAIGYSMGAQMTVFLASEHQAIDAIATMVPPAVDNVPDVAPIAVAGKVTADWLLLTASKDQFSTAEQNAALVSAVKAPLTHQAFESGHVLPVEYIGAIEKWVSTLE